MATVDLTKWRQLSEAQAEMHPCTDERRAAPMDWFEQRALIDEALDMRFVICEFDTYVSKLRRALPEDVLKSLPEWDRAGLDLALAHAQKFVTG